MRDQTGLFSQLISGADGTALILDYLRWFLTSCCTFVHGYASTNLDPTGFGRKAKVYSVPLSRLLTSTQQPSNLFEQSSVFSAFPSKLAHPGNRHADSHVCFLHIQAIDISVNLHNKVTKGELFNVHILKPISLTTLFKAYAAKALRELHQNKEIEGRVAGK